MAPHAIERLGRCDLMEMVVRCTNLQYALRPMISNKGSPRIDWMMVSELTAHLQGHREEIC
jgi:hypothetical protein